ncbi:MAG: hypothetical protein ACLGHA_05640 [Gammaproteobacteria bacterium]
MKRMNPLRRIGLALLAGMLLALGASPAQATAQPAGATMSTTTAQPAAAVDVIRVAWDRVGSTA